jgi:hypothetical protein
MELGLGTYENVSIPMTELAELRVAMRALERLDAQVDGTNVHSLDMEMQS